MKADTPGRQRRLCIIDRVEEDRWFPGDRFVRPVLRRLLRGAPTPSGLDAVRTNLCRGLERLGVPFVVNPSFRSIEVDDLVCVLGRGRRSLAGYDRPNRILAGVGLMTHPSEWASLFDDYPVARYLQHSTWTRNVYAPYFGDRCLVWPVGIDTDTWRAGSADAKSVDFLIYDKVRWNRETNVPSLLAPIQSLLRQRNLSFEELRYGAYRPPQYQEALRRCRAMMFLCEHESQGLAYQEALASGVPVLAWDQGWCLDPNRFRWGAPNIPASSVPYWDERCGRTFSSASDFPAALDRFLDERAGGRYLPRDYVLEHLTLEKCAQRYVDIAHEVL